MNDHRFQCKYGRLVKNVIPAATTRMNLLPFLLILLVCIRIDLVSSTSSTSSISSTSNDISNSKELYNDVRALDKYGNVPQIRNARSAADRQGSPVVFAISTPSHKTSGSGSSRSSPEPESIVVASVGKIIPSRIPSEPSPRIAVLSREDHDFNSDSTNDDEDNGKISSSSSSIVATVITGNAPDASLLIYLLREDAVRSWEKYGSNPSTLSTIEAAGDVLQGFMKRSSGSKDAIIGRGNGSIIDRGHSGDGQNGDRGTVGTGRPLGLTAWIMSPGFTDARHRQSMNIGTDTDLMEESSDYGGMVAEVRVVDPSGTASLPIVAGAMGKGRDDIETSLSKHWKLGMTVDEVKDMLVKVLREDLDVDRELEEERDEAKGGSGDYDGRRQRQKEDQKDECIVCEVLSDRGIQVTRFPLVDGVVA